MEHLNDFIIIIKSNIGNIFTGLIGLVTTALGYKVMFGKNNIETKKIEIDAKNVDLQEDKYLLERANAIDNRMDRLVAYLERQIENINKKAAEEREAARLERAEMKSVISTQTTEIRSLKDHIDRLAKIITELGGQVPRYFSGSDNSKAD